MALFKPSAIASDIRGTLAGTVFSKNRGGNYIRQKVTPVNPKTSFQTVVRNRLASFSQGWRALTAAQINAWNAAVAGFAKTNIFGDLRNPTGLQLYVKVNANLVSSGGTAITTPAAPKGVSVVTIGALTYTSALLLSLSLIVQPYQLVRV